MKTSTYSPQESAGKLRSYAAEAAEYRWYIERLPIYVKMYGSPRMVHATLQSSSATRTRRCRAADKCVTEQTSSPFPARVLVVTENTDALYDCDSFGGLV